MDEDPGTADRRGRVPEDFGVWRQTLHKRVIGQDEAVHGGSKGSESEAEWA